jgi:hypothetical protein
MFAQMVKLHLENDHSERTVKKITPEQYLEWEKNYCFDGLKGWPLGQSFCYTFGIIDHILVFNSIDSDRMVQYIKDTYIE